MSEEQKHFDFIKDLDKAKHSKESIFELIKRPNKQINAYSQKEIQEEGIRILAVYLLRKGFVVKDVEVSSHIDIVADYNGKTVLLEVKTKRSLGSSAIPSLDTSIKKQEVLKQAAIKYMKNNKGLEQVRFDCVSIEIVGQEKASLRHLVNACEVSISSK